MHPQAPAELRSRAWPAPAPARNRTRARVPTVAKRRIFEVILLSLHRGAGRTFMARRSASCKPSRAAPSCFREILAWAGIRGSALFRTAGRGDLDALEREQSVSHGRAAGRREIHVQDIRGAGAKDENIDFRKSCSENSSTVLRIFRSDIQKYLLTFRAPFVQSQTQTRRRFIARKSHPTCSRPEPWRRRISKRSRL